MLKAVEPRSAKLSINTYRGYLTRAGQDPPKEVPEPRACYTGTLL